MSFFLDGSHGSFPMEKRIRKLGGWAASGSCTRRGGPRAGGRRKKGALLEMDGQKAMVIHPPSRERHSVRPSAVRGKLERDTRVMQSRGERGREKRRKKKGGSALGRRRARRGVTDANLVKCERKEEMTTTATMMMMNAAPPRRRSADWVEGANGAR